MVLSLFCSHVAERKTVIGAYVVAVMYVEKEMPYYPVLLGEIPKRTSVRLPIHVRQEAWPRAQTFTLTCEITFRNKAWGRNLPHRGPSGCQHG